jgi:CDP-diacylglycerol--glycerol-3-phosphate 3-phosphatidyltransferase
MNVPNYLTLSRLVMAMVLLLLLSVQIPFAKSAALGLFVLAGITDYLDGWMARRTRQETSFGALMDPLSDKVIICAAFVGLVELQLVRGAVAVIIIAREFLVTGLRMVALSQGRVIPAGRWGKHKTLWQIVAIVLILGGLAVREDVLARTRWGGLEAYDRYFDWMTQGLSWMVVAITVFSGWKYFMEHRALLTKELRGRTPDSIAGEVAECGRRE